MQRRRQRTRDTAHGGRRAARGMAGHCPKGGARQLPAQDAAAHGRRGTGPRTAAMHGPSARGAAAHGWAGQGRRWEIRKSEFLRLTHWFSIRKGKFYGKITAVLQTPRTSEIQKSERVQISEFCVQKSEFAKVNNSDSQTRTFGNLHGPTPPRQGRGAAITQRPTADTGHGARGQTRRPRDGAALPNGRATTTARAGRGCTRATGHGAEGGRCVIIAAPAPCLGGVGPCRFPRR